jgi:hypothetical protein
MRRYQAPPPLTETVIDAILRTARERLKEGEWYPCNHYKLLAEFESLGLETDEQKLEALQRAAAEVSPIDFDDPEPPGVSVEPMCRGVQMVPFVWTSPTFGMEMYFKIGLNRDGCLMVFSLHEADYKKKSRTR